MDALLYKVRRFGASLLDIILPRSARRMRAEALSPEDLVLAPMAHSMLGAEITTLAQYDDVRDAIQSLKYDRSVSSARLLAGALSEFLQDDIASRKLFSKKEILLIPIPLHAARKRERGYNQIGMVIDALPNAFKDGTLSRIAAPVLERTRETRQQTKLSRAARLSNVAGAFTVSDPTLVERAHVYLIDDVATTGATLLNAGAPLRAAGAEVTMLALARA